MGYEFVFQMTMNNFGELRTAALVTTILLIITFPYCIWVYATVEQVLDFSDPHEKRVFHYGFQTRHYIVMLINLIIGSLQLYGVARKKSFFLIPWLIWLISVLIVIVSSINKIDKEQIVISIAVFGFYLYSFVMTYGFYEMLFQRENNKSSASSEYHQLQYHAARINDGTNVTEKSRVC